MTRFSILMVALLLGCGGGAEEEEEGVTCGDSLVCGDGEFCLSYLAAGAGSGEEEYSCEAFPGDCDSFDAMCFDDPDPCVGDWVAEVCPADTFSSGCVSGFGSEEAFCQSGYTSQ